jgi:hypothetical protein
MAYLHLSHSIKAMFVCLNASKFNERQWVGVFGIKNEKQAEGLKQAKEQLGITLSSLG